MQWFQIYDPFGSPWLSTLAAALPVVVMLACLGFLHMRAHVAALLGLGMALLVAVVAFGMPPQMAGGAAAYGALVGLMPIGWIVVNIIFLYNLTNDAGLFKVMQDSIAGVTEDKRLQLLLIAFCFGAFFEGAAGFGTPVAVTGAMLMGLGFSPLAASGLSLIANTAPVAYGALGSPVIALAAVTGLDLLDLSAMIGRQLPFFSVIVPFWLIIAFAGFRGAMQIWPAILVAGVSFAVPQFLVSNFHGPWLVDVVAAIVSILCLTGFLKLWQPRETWTSPKGEAPSVATGRPALSLSSAAVGDDGSVPAAPVTRHPRSLVLKAWAPWLLLAALVFVWGVPSMKAWLNSLWIWSTPVHGLHNLVVKVAPVATRPAPEAAVYTFNILSAAGTGILISAVLAGFMIGLSPAKIAKTYWRTLVAVRTSLLTIAAMIALGYVTKYSGLDATLGLAFANTGVLFPFFGAMLGWLGVALTGSDTASNVLFGGLQKVSAEQLGLSPTLMAAANSSGGVMGKMIDAQSIVVAATATKWYGQEGVILRYVFWHSVALASLVGLLITAQAYLWPFTLMVVR